MLTTLVDSIKKLNVFNDKIEVDRISYSVEDKVVFNDFSFIIHKMDKIYLNGMSGRGKTTLLHILAGLKQIDSGEIRVDGTKLNYAWLEQVSYVEQKPFYFKGSLKENIVVGKTFDSDLYEQVLFMCQISSNMHQKDLGEQGANFSGGQLQRIALARALYQDKELLLLDESLNALDVESRSAILSNILKLNKTIVVVGHGFEVLESLGFTKIITL